MNGYQRLASIWSVVVLLLAAVGCGGPSRVAAPEINASLAATKAMEMYDSNTDGTLDEEELKACPAFARAMEEMDTDGDGTLSEAEVLTRIEFIVAGRDGRCSLACRVQKGNTPVPGVEVTFVPEPFMADMIVSATGTTNHGGMASIHIQDQMGGIQPGFYKVELSKQSSSGKEAIKKKFNTETILGQEVTSGSVALSTGLVFKI